MKKQGLRALSFVALTGMAVTGCDILDELDYTVTPNPLELHGDSVAVKITATIPAKGLHKKASVDVTPVLIYEDGEQEFKKVVYQGEKAAGNAEVISFTEASDIEYTDMILYTPQMEHSELKVKLVGKKGKKIYPAEMSKKIADGIITTPLLVMEDGPVLFGQNQFKRVTAEMEKATINYLVNSSHVRSSELRDADMSAISKFIVKAGKDEKLNVKSLSVKAWASPEGELTKNENLANERAASASKVVSGLLKRNKLTLEESSYSLTGAGEDWEGFRTLVEASTSPDKDLILRILEMESDPAVRETEIKNLSKTFVELKRDILPQLRRSDMTLVYEMVGKSDQEIIDMAASNPEGLNIEEMLFFCDSLTSDMGEKEKMYRLVETKFPNDWRGSNNVGCMLMMQNKLDEAKVKFEKANGIQENPFSLNNLGVVSRMKGDRATAEEYFRKAGAAGPDAHYNLGIILIQKGEYEEAIEVMAGRKTFNLALAQTLNKNYEDALSTLEVAVEKDMALSYYLKAIIGSRTNNKELMTTNLKTAISKSSSLKIKAEKDREFIKYFSDADFKAALN